MPTVQGDGGNRQPSSQRLQQNCTDYKGRHNKVASMLNWNLCKKYHLPAANKWWEHKIEKVLQKNEAKILWDFKIQTDKHLAHNIPDITVVERSKYG